MNIELQQDLPRSTSSRQVQLQELSAAHRGVASLLAQGADRHIAGAAFGFSPEYVTWLGGDPLFQQHVREMNKLVATRLELLYGKSVDVIAETMQSGGAEEKLKAARLQLEATGRVGNSRRTDTGEVSPDFLEELSQNLVQLLHKRKGVTYDVEPQVEPD